MTRRGRSREEWRQLIRQWESSSETAEGFCERHDLGLSTFRWWRWFLRQGSGEAWGPRQEPCEAWVEVTPVSLPPSAQESGASDLRLVLGEGITIRVPVGFDAPTLERLIQTLGVIEC